MIILKSNTEYTELIKKVTLKFLRKFLLNIKERMLLFCMNKLV